MVSTAGTIDAHTKAIYFYRNHRVEKENTHAKNTPMWTLEEGLEVVRGLQEIARKFGYHVTVGGGVINDGYSFKDLDIYFMPMGSLERNPDGLKERLIQIYNAQWKLMGHKDYPQEAHFITKGILTLPPESESDYYHPAELKRIDVFIAKEPNDGNTSKLVSRWRRLFQRRSEDCPI